jgi:hypothetical protein
MSCNVRIRRGEALTRCGGIGPKLRLINGGHTPP